MSIKLSGISKIYGEQHAVDDISFDAEPGQVIGLLGPNGAGKTTTMKILTCYIPATKGSATVCGYDVQTHPLEVRNKIGYLPEHNPLYKEMYVREYLELVARIFKIENKKARVEELIEMTGLTTESKKKIEFLSKGYRQRVGLAQAMMNDPEVLILDEPTSGLDPNQLVDIRALIKDLGKEKLVLFSSHIMQEVQALCDRVIILNNGKLVADDPIENLGGRVRGERQLQVDFKLKMPLAEIEKLEGILRIKEISGTSYQIFTEDKVDVREAIFDLAVEKGNKLLAMSQEDLSIESIFQSITNSEK